MRDKDRQLDEFFIKYRTMVFRNVYYMLNDYYAAEDICQETFLRLSRDIDRIPPGSVKSWLIRVSGNLAIDYTRKGGKYHIEVGLEEGVMEIADEFWVDPVQILEKKEKCKDRERVLLRLKEEKPKWYEVILMSHLEGLDNRAIGKAMGISPLLVSQWKRRATKWLQEAYREEEQKKERGR